MKGESQTSSPAAAAELAAVFNRSRSPPVIRTALQCRSSRMTRSSRATTSGSKGSWVLTPRLKKPVS